MLKIKKMRNIIFLIIILFVFNSCGGLKEAGSVLRNEKVRTTDEFLVKKRNPLVLPPNYEEIPQPGTTDKKKEDEKENIKKTLKAPTQEKITKSQSSLEKTILNQIRK